MKRYIVMFLMMMGLILADINREGMPLVPLTRFGTTSSTTQALSAASNATLAGATFVAHGTSIASVKVYVTALAGTEANRKLKAFITAIDATGDPDEGTPVGSKEITGATIVVGINTLTFASPLTVTAGTTYGVYVQNTAAASNTDYVTIQYRCATFGGYSQPFATVSADTGGTWTRSGNSPCVCPVYADGTIQSGFMSGYQTALTMADDHNPDEYANAFTVTNATLCTGMQILANVADTTNLVCELIEDSTAIKTITLNHHSFKDFTSTSVISVPWAAYSCHSGHTYYLSIWTDETTHVGLTGNYFTESASKVAYNGSVLYGAVRNDGHDTSNAWTAYNSGSDYRVYPIVPIFTTETISAGGAVKRDMDGGFNK